MCHDPVMIGIATCLQGFGREGLKMVEVQMVGAWGCPFLDSKSVLATLAKERFPCTEMMAKHVWHNMYVTLQFMDFFRNSSYCFFLKCFSVPIQKLQSQNMSAAKVPGTRRDSWAIQSLRENLRKLFQLDQLDTESVFVNAPNAPNAVQVSARCHWLGLETERAAIPIYGCCLWWL